MSENHQLEKTLWFNAYIYITTSQEGTKAFMKK
jgi:hypothetical protein